MNFFSYSKRKFNYEDAFNECRKNGYMEFLMPLGMLRKFYVSYFTM